MDLTNVQHVSGTDLPANGAVDKTIIAAPAVGKRLYVQKVFIGVTVAATGGGGEVSLEDGAGGTKFVTMDADAAGTLSHDFGIPGYPMSLATLLNATVDGAATNQATARVTVTGIYI